ncbi:MAG: DUF4394 domain-containing protein [Beijerinckiaceae bacterium]|nr:DUF4394 domain-containing protein [Beijerinckiaceae bacterium]MCI0736878.1 DUF4394 domain-containing protein [Beijerinckiaceae bacterium]
MIHTASLTLNNDQRNELFQERSRTMAAFLAKRRLGVWRHFFTVTCTLLAGLILAAGTAQATGFIGQLKVIGLTADGLSLVSFRAVSPQRATVLGRVRGLVSPDRRLIGIDFRVQDGNLYGVGNGGGIYTIDPSAQAARIDKLSVPLSGNSFGVDFNPAANALRIVSDTGQNLRHPFSAPIPRTTNADAMLTYTQPPVDPTLPRPTPVTAPGIGAAAYTNNDLETDPAQAQTATTLFDIDTNLDQVVIQSPPNNGILVAAGKLGVDAASIAGFDIYSRLNGKSLTSRNFAFAVLQVNSRPVLYSISLTTGAATPIGNFNMPVADIALPLNQNISGNTGPGFDLP